MNRTGVGVVQNAVIGRKTTASGSKAILHIIRILRESQVYLPEKRSGGIKPLFLGIIPTRQCNLSCAYCGFGARNAGDIRMDYATAVTAVTWMIETAQANGENSIEVHFFGGEPFSAGDVVDVVVHRTRAEATKAGIIPRFEVATNGVFDKDRMRFVGEYFDTVVLSFDGLEDIHNLHRSRKNGAGSFSEVARTADGLANTGVEICFRTCVSRESVRRLGNISRLFAESFSPNTVCFETLQPNAESGEAGLSPPDPFAFSAAYVHARAILKRYGINVVYSAADTSRSRYSFCPVGKDAAIVSPDGRVSGCYLLQHEWKGRGLDLDIGLIEPNGTIHVAQEAVDRLRTLVMDKPLCDRCFCKWTCAGGCHVNQTYPGCQSTYNDFCAQTRIITACSLLEDLGFTNLTHDLISDGHAMEALAYQSSDLLENWNG